MLQSNFATDFAMLVSVLLLLLQSCAALLVGVRPMPATVRAAGPRAAAAGLPPKCVALVAALGQDPSVIDFEDTMGAIEEMYDFTPMAFSVGDVVSEASLLRSPHQHSCTSTWFSGSPTSFSMLAHTSITSRMRKRWS